jgi:glycosyltransferase involved in cell wall biosynthesis
MPSKTKILIITDSPVLPTGLAETTRLIFGTLGSKYPDCYDIEQIGLSHCAAVTHAQWTVHPTAARKDKNGELMLLPEDRYAEQTFARLLPVIKPDVVFNFGDPQNVLHICIPPDKRQFKLVLYLNFDGLPIPASYGPILRHADLLLTKSEFSMQVVANCLPEVCRGKLGYMYSPADTARFAPTGEAVKTKLRRELLPSWIHEDAFILGWVGRNIWRKQVWVLYKVLHYLRKGDYHICLDCGRVSLWDWDPSRHRTLKDDQLVLESRPGYRYNCCGQCGSTEVKAAQPLADLFLWCHMADEPNPPWPLRWLEQQFDVLRDRDVYYTEEYHLKSALAPDDVPTLYHLWDCLLFLSGGEGFGLPAWEAMCCALPVVFTNYSAHGEFLTRANGGIGVGGILQPERTNCIWRMIADIPQVIEAVRKLYLDRQLARQLGRNGRQFAERFSLAQQVEVWHRILQMVINGNVQKDVVGSARESLGYQIAAGL